MTIEIKLPPVHMLPALHNLDAGWVSLLDPLRQLSHLRRLTREAWSIHFYACAKGKDDLLLGDVCVTQDFVYERHLLRYYVGDKLDHVEWSDAWSSWQLDNSRTSFYDALKMACRRVRDEYRYDTIEARFES